MIYLYFLQNLNQFKKRIFKSQENIQNSSKESNNIPQSELDFEEKMKTLVNMLLSMKGSEENTFVFNPSIKKDKQILSKRNHSPDLESNKRRNSEQYTFNPAHKRKNDSEDTDHHKRSNTGQYIYNKSTKRPMSEEENTDQTKKTRIEEIINNYPKKIQQY
ncbi:hypothetical protein PIROE2DRAFT_60436 [Piromyces sp. E2]|nr:hypothetical protein PIROE2DRAFT_60436 [Piromyces sp. E2]|eukprot:OUM64790.1 hypothetical protein PIROE2DRAFT_60436 [Piromyces sp. E2]